MIPRALGKTLEEEARGRFNLAYEMTSSTGDGRSCPRMRYSDKGTATTVAVLSEIGQAKKYGKFGS